MSPETEVGRRRFAWAAAAAVVLLTLPRLLLHELWRDESWLWLVVAESDSLGELFAPLARSGQGYLFPLLCYLARQVSTSPRAMQFLHLVLVGAAAWAFVRWAPFGRRERALVALGYFPFFEYAVISRHYVLGVLLAWLFCAAARLRRPALARGAIFGLLCQTTVYGCILAVALTGGWLLDRRLRRAELEPLRPADTAAGAVLALAGLVAGVVQLIPLPGTSFAPGWRFGWDPLQVEAVLRMPWRALVPLPRPGLNFWNTNLLDPWPHLQAAAGLLMLALAAALLWRRKVALATFGLGAAGILAFGYVKYAGVLRHQGHLWILLVAALWLGGETFRKRAEAEQPHHRSWPAWILFSLLLLHCGAAAYASWMDLRHPFSNGAATADLLRTSRLDRHPLLGHREPPAATVALFLGQPLYSPSRRLFVLYPDWGPEQRELPPQDVRCAARALVRQRASDIILVLSWEPPPWEELIPAGSRLGAIVGTEDFRLYRLSYRLLAPTASAARCPGETALSAR